MSKKIAVLMVGLVGLILIGVVSMTAFTKNISLKEIFQTVPVIQSKLCRLPSAYDTKPTFAGKFNKAAYEGDPLENIELGEAKLIMADGKEIDVLEEICPSSMEKKGEVG
ncbi:MAG: hypothetical protein ABIH69_03660 [bacterium]